MEDARGMRRRSGDWRCSGTEGCGRPARLTYSVDEVADVLGLSRSKTYELVARGELPIVPLAGRRKLIARATVERLLGGEPSSRAASGPAD